MTRDRRIVEGYGIVFDEPTRLAHQALLEWAAYDPEGDGWPTPADVVRFARFYGIPAARLGGLFGLLSRRVGRRVVWADMARAPEVGARIGVATFSHDALVAYGFFRASWAVFERDRATIQ